MESQKTSQPSSARAKTPLEQPSPVRALITWLVEADREFRVAQSMVNDTHDRL